MFISPAYAQAGDAGSGFATILPLVLIFAVFYFLLIRPQQKKAKVHREMLGSIGRGDRVITGGGIMGKVTKVVNDQELAVEIAEGIKVRVQRSMVAGVISKEGGSSTMAAPGGQQQAGGLLGGLFGRK